ncbi:hypothetical protein CDD81_3468 [Ophiocordyceps australis]|uniref:Fungal lipase-type domain-containing protein n=1 Tax=Ophiocordyceps australis TaxID=1399860 RepID=A0A2C5YC81_9HYPO|nr:hypothetical protein CDD81_3468 [Ophiocordyceps australis]
MVRFGVCAVAMLGVVAGRELRPSNDTISPKTLRDIYVFAAYSHAAYCPPNHDGHAGNPLCSRPPCTSLIPPSSTTRHEFSSAKSPVAGNVVVMDRGLASQDVLPTLVVSFRGSMGMGDFLRNMRFSQVDIGLCANCSVHEGFMEAYDEIKDALGEVLNKNLAAAADKRLVRRGKPKWEKVERPIYGKHPERLEGRRRDSDDKMQQTPSQVDGGKPGIGLLGDRKEYIDHVKQAQARRRARDKAWRRRQKADPSASRYALFKPDADTLFHDEPAPRIVLTGHSYGGAIATIAAAHLRAQGHVVDLFTYGSPRVGNRAFAQFASHGPYERYQRSGSGGSQIARHAGITARVTNKRDLVAAQPPMAIPFGYAHVSPEYWFSEGMDKPAFPFNLKVCHGTSELRQHGITAYSNDDGICESGAKRRGLAVGMEGLTVAIASTWAWE